MSTDTAIARLIHDWFTADLHYTKEQELGHEIDAAIASVYGPLTLAEYAWKYWNECENEISNTAGFYDMMDLCAYAEWCADVELGYTTEPFSGVPRLIITLGAPA